MTRQLNTANIASPNWDTTSLRDVKCLWLAALLFGCGGAEDGREAESIDPTKSHGGAVSAPHAQGPAGTGASGGTGPDPLAPSGSSAGVGSGMMVAAGTRAPATPPSGGESVGLAPSAGTAGIAAGGVGGSAVAGSDAAGSGSSDGGGGTAGAGSAQGGSSGNAGAAAPEAGTSATPSYPPLTAAAIGTPTRIASGFGLAESPLWDPCTKTLMFADVQGDNGKGAIHALDADGKVTTIATNTGNTNGFAYDIDGSLVLAQMNGHVARRSKSGDVTTIEATGARLHTPDDVVVRSDGTIYFSDGDFCPIGNLLGFNAVLPVFMIRPGSSELVRLGTVSGPNGIELSPDEKLLYVNGFGDGTISVFDVAADGMATKRSTHLANRLDNPDSMCLDAAGNLYVGVSAGLEVIHADGRRLKLVAINSPAGSCTTAGVTNCTFGGDDGKTLYITTWTQVWRIENMPIPGLDWVVGQQRAQCN